MLQHVVNDMELQCQLECSEVWIDTVSVVACQTTDIRYGPLDMMGVSACETRRLVHGRRY